MIENVFDGLIINCKATATFSKYFIKVELQKFRYDLDDSLQYLFWHISMQNSRSFQPNMNGKYKYQEKHWRQHLQSFNNLIFT